MGRRTILSGILILGLVVWLLGPSAVLAQDDQGDGNNASPLLVTSQAVVHAVLFWSPGCPHCHEVIENVLPPLQARYGLQLEIKLLDISKGENAHLFLAAAQSFGIEPEQAGVPFMVIGDRLLLGSRQIPQELPGLIQKHLAAGGVDWPSAGGIAAAVAPVTDVAMCGPATPRVDPPAAATSAVASPTGFANGFTLAVVIMLGMVGALVYSGARLASRRAVLSAAPRLHTLVLVLSIIGLSVAGYLAYVETQAVSAVCGPVGDCNAVQSSPYARLFGVLPIGVLGMLGYLAILAVWLYGRLRSDRLAGYAPHAVFAMTLFGVLFSLYLTFLEPFVIKAVCAWCLASAVIMTLLLVIVTQSLQPRTAGAPAHKASSATISDAMQRDS